MLLRVEFASFVRIIFAPSGSELDNDLAVTGVLQFSGIWKMV
jgi:hypothetical protein